MTLHRKLVAIKTISIIALPILLVGCGSKRELQPTAGAELPAKPYGAEEQPTANDLLEPSTQARPGRSVELRRRSEVREDDPFDLPPD
ncbi:hypothetical protein [Alterisphingorhabdus coralli]|uniref:Uncharacterized protein n=1 Tax=Alterisphingorhabdus coralli TaxID=3071408 RepID=A0AA97I2B4_9SPHN|nr:hypothetical protein [Parasphingorhabdus sp. SCSIO 66989]WOE76215.1 hypothetical protein RB602_05755 [Parasphingorhabdus sp. SCSIO 66989]